MRSTSNPAGSRRRPARHPRRLRFAALLVLSSLLLLEGIARILPKPIGPSSTFDKRVSADWGDLSRELTPVTFETSEDYDAFRPYLPDPELGWKLRPHHTLSTIDPRESSRRVELRRWSFNISGQGFRSPEFELEPSHDWRRIVVFGASSSFGWGVSEGESWVDRVRERRREDKVEIINVSVPGYSSEQGWILARAMLPRLKPDLVLFGLGANDSQRALRPDFKVIGAGRTDWRRFQAAFQSSALYRRLSDLIHLWRLSAAEDHDAFVRRVPPERYSRILVELSDSAAAHSAQISFFSLCFDPQSTRTQRATAARLEIAAVDLDRRLRSWLEEEGAKGLVESMEPEWRELAAKEFRIWKADLKRDPRLWVLQPDMCHPNSLGHQVIAQAMDSFVRSVLPDVEPKPGLSAEVVRP